MRSTAWHLGIDAGGTFTDVMAVSSDGRIQVLKVPSTPARPVLGPLNGIEHMKPTLEVGTIASVSHGTTVGLNALLQRKFPPVGLIVTRGFKHVLEIARHTVPGEWGTIYSWVKPPRVVPLSQVHEIDERVSQDGNVVTPLDEASVHHAADALAAAGARTVAVCLLHAYRFAAHEQRVREILLEHRPDWLISLSSEVMPEFREYERMVTTATNAVLAPLVGQYFAEFGAEVSSVVGPDTSVYIMRSAGGVASPEEAAAHPLRTALSGPAAGVVGMGRLAREAGFGHAITFDMGGTSTDVSAVEDGEPHLTTDASIDCYPLRTPTIDLVTIGAGGGSLIAIGTARRIMVGPDSAGADPGPVCYGKGGMEPTLTDANLVLGRIPQALVGGEFALDAAAARAALETRAAQLAMDGHTLAYSAVEIVCNNMAGAVRQVSIKRGLDPRQYTLVAFGGAGPMHAARMAELLGMPRVLVPVHPGLGSCAGLILSDVRIDQSSTFLRLESDFDAGQFASLFTRLEEALAPNLECYSDVVTQFQRSVDMRYLGMGTELNVPAPAGPMTAGWLEQLVADYHALHEKIFNFSYRGSQAVQSIALRVTAVGRRSTRIPEYDFAHAVSRPTVAARRSALFNPERGFELAPVYRRVDLPAGWSERGPLFVDQYDTTTVVLPGHGVGVDEHGNLIIHNPGATA